jgi:hypothetical protein
LSSESRTLAHLAHPVRAAGRDRRGIATIEFGFVMAAIIVIVLGTYDIGNFVLQQAKLAEAAEAGGLYATSFPGDTVGTTCAVEAALCPGVSYSLSAGCSGATCPLPSINVGAPTTESGSTTVTITLTGSYAPLLLTGILTSTGALYVAQVQ